MSTAIHEIALELWRKNPHKCFQRHVRELHAEQAQREQLPSLSEAKVVRVSNAEAGSIIRVYEWLGTMSYGTRACYGLKIGGELLGVACLGVGSSHEARNICGEQHIEKSVCLQRGACVPWAPKNAASFLIRHAC